jgi:hypothetical protein
MVHLAARLDIVRLTTVFPALLLVLFAFEEGLLAEAEVVVTFESVALSKLFLPVFAWGTTLFPFLFSFPFPPLLNFNLSRTGHVVPFSCPFVLETGVCDIRHFFAE